MAFDFNNEEFDLDDIEQTRKIVVDCAKMQERLEQYPFDRKFQELVYGKILLLVLGKKEEFKYNNELTNKILELPIDVEKLTDDELMSALKDLDDVVTALGLGQIKNSSWTYHDLIGLAISKRLDLLFQVNIHTE